MIERFEDLAEYYPGSRERRQTVPASRPGAVEEDDLLGDPVIMVLRGREVEFFTIGQVARAIGRSPVTLRSWEANGILPKSGYHTMAKDHRGRRRLYTRPQSEGIIRIARELGVTGSGSRKPLAEFGRRVHQLFLNLMGAK